MWYYQYALFLSSVYGSTRATDIAQLLTHVYSERPSNMGTMERTLLQARAGQDKPKVVAVAKMAPGFKSYLETIGWNKKDF